MAQDRYYIGSSDEPLKTMEERAAEERAKLIEKSRYEFHVDLDFDAAVEKIESFDSYEPFVPGELRQYSDTRVYFRVFERHFMRSEGYASLSVLMEELPRFGVDMIAIVSGAGQGLYNLKAGVNEDYIAQFKRHMGLEVPRDSLAKKAKRFFFE